MSEIAEFVTATEARTLRLLAGKPLAEVQRWWRLETLEGLDREAIVPSARALAPTNYAELELLEQAAMVKTERIYLCNVCSYRSFITTQSHTPRACPQFNCGGTQSPQ